MENSNILIQLEGNADDLLMVNKVKSMKCTRLIDVAADSDVENEEVLDVCITSTNPYGDFPKFDQLIGKKICITIEEIK